MTALIRTHRGDSIPIAQVTKITPTNVVAGDSFTIACNGKSYTFVSVLGTASEVAAGLVALLQANALGIVEFTEFIASTVLAAAPSSNDGSYILLTAATPGVPFRVTTSTSVTAAGSVTVAESTPGKLPVNEVHEISLLGTYTGGNFTITYSFGTTAAISYNATAAQVQSALAALAGVGAGNVLVTGGPGPNSPWFVTWQGTLAGTAVATGTINGTGLTGNGAVQIAETQAGHGLSSSLQHIDVTAEYAAANNWNQVFKLSLNGQLTGNLLAQATPATIQTALQALPNIGAGNCLVYGTGSTVGVEHWYVLFTGALANQDVALLQITDVNGVALPNTVATMLQRGGQTTQDGFQLVDTSGQVGGGTFTLTYNGKTTGPISPIETAAGGVESAVQSALNALSTISGSMTCVVYGLGTNWQSPTPILNGSLAVRFIGAQAAGMKQLTINGAGLTGANLTPSTSVMLDGITQVNEIQSVTVFGTGGTFTLTLNSQTTAATAWNATAATLQANIIAAFTNTLTACTVTGAGTLASPYLVTITNPANTKIALMTGSGALLTGGGGTIVELTHGAAGVNEVQMVTLAAGVSGGTFTLSFGGLPTAAIAWNAAAATVQADLVALSTVNTVTVAGAAGGPWTVTWSGAQGAAPQPLLVANGANLTGLTGSQALPWSTQTFSAGPHHYDDPLNWTGAVVPNSNEAIEFDPSSSSCLYGLNQIATFAWNVGSNLGTFAGAFPCDLQNGQAVYLTTTSALPAGLAANTVYYLIAVSRDAQTFQLAATPGGAAINVTTTGTGVHTCGVRLASVEVSSRYTGDIGLARENSANYFEYRALNLHFGLQTLANGGLQTVTVGTGHGSGNGKTQVDFDVDAATVLIVKSGGSSDTAARAVMAKGTNPANTLKVLSGDFGSALYEGEVANFASVECRGGTVELGPGVSVTGPVAVTGGTLVCDGCTLNGTVTL